MSLALVSCEHDNERDQSCGLCRPVPVQKPGRSRQDYATPRAFLDAVERRFGRIHWDLAAHRGNETTGRGCFYGPGSPHGGSEDSLQIPWTQYGPRLPSGDAALQWLNPPYAHIEPWVAKASAEADIGARIAVLVPAAVGSNWFRRHVHHRAAVLALSPRLTFVGCRDTYPKDLMLCLYGLGFAPGFDVWRWR